MSSLPPLPSPLPDVIVLATLIGESSPYKLDPSPNKKKRGITVSREPSLLNTYKRSKEATNIR